MKVETRRIHISNKAKVWGEVEVVVIMFAELA